MTGAGIGGQIPSDMRLISAAPIAARLQAAGYAHVDSIVEWSLLEKPPAHSPALYVVPDDERAGESRLSGVIDQLVRASFRVIIVIKAQARRKEAPGEMLEMEIRKLRGALLGWQHPEAAGPTEYGGGTLLSADGRLIAWSVQFRCNYHLRKMP